MRLTVRDWIGLLVAIALLATVVAVIVLHGPKGFRVVDPLQATMSLIFLLAGMFSQFMVWHTSARIFVGPLSMSVTFSSHALTIWGKYVPGKVWSVIGRASVLAYEGGKPLPRLMVASSIAQLSMIATGIALALPVIVASKKIEELGVNGGMILVLVIISLALISVVVTAYYSIGGFERKRTLIHGIGLAMFGMMAWIFWGTGFHYLLSSSGHATGLFQDVAIFSAGTTLGILAVITPGGLGIREGAITVLLNVNGIDWSMAALAAVAARVWFVFGEVCIFICGWQVRRFSRKTN